MAASSLGNQNITSFPEAIKTLSKMLLNDSNEYPSTLIFFSLNSKKTKKNRYARSNVAMALAGQNLSSFPEAIQALSQAVFKEKDM